MRASTLLIHVKERPPDVSVEQRTFDELTKLVRKLRWMGFEREAVRTQRMLSEVALLGGVPTTPQEAD